MDPPWNSRCQHGSVVACPSGPQRFRQNHRPNGMSPVLRDIASTGSAAGHTLGADKARLVPRWYQGHLGTFRQRIPGLVNVNTKLWKDPPCFMGKLAISMAIFNSYFDITRGYLKQEHVTNQEAKKTLDASSF